MPSTQAQRINTFARLLGWPRPRELRHRFDAGGPREVVWFEAAIAPGVHLQINTHGGPRAAVVAVRYRLHTGFHRIALPASEAALAREAARLSGLLARFWFDDPGRRRAFRTLHPDCAGWTWQRIRQEGERLIKT